MEDIKKVTKTTTVKKNSQKTASAPKKSPAKSKKTESKKPMPGAKETAKIVAWTKNKAMPAVGNAFKATGRGIGHAFMEMSGSLAGWVDDTSKQLKRELTKQPEQKTVKKTSSKRVATKTSHK